MNKVNPLGAGIALAATFALPSALCAIAFVVVPGFRPFADLLTQFYGFYGYSVSMPGVFVGAFWGLVEGFFHFGIFAWLYNVLLEWQTRRSESQRSRQT